MLNVKIILVGIGSIVGVVSPVFYLTVKYNSEKELNLQLNQVLNETLQEKERLQKYTFEIEEKIEVQENKLKQLSNVQAIRDALNNAQQTIEQLNKELTHLNAERAALQEANVNANTRLQNTTNELMRITSDLKLAKDDIAKFNVGQVSMLKRKIEDLSAESDLKNKDLAKLKEELAKLQATNQSLIENNKNLEKNLKDLQREKGVASQKISLKEMQENISQLNSALAKKEIQIKQLEDELTKLSSLPPQVVERTDKRQQKIMDTLNSEKSKFRRKISDLENELNLAKKEVNSLKGRKESGELKALYESARGQLSRLSELLVKKELEIDSAKKESLESKEKLISLQARLSKLESELPVHKTNSEKLQELEREKSSLDSRLKEVQETLAQKGKLVDSLQKNLEYLSAQLAKKEKEIKSIESSYAQVESVAKQELDKQKSQYEELNLLYNSLKVQLGQFSDGLNEKELELEQRSRQTSSLKEQIASFKSRSEELEKQLLDAKERHRKTLDDLVAAIRLNTILQERIIGVSPSKESSKPISAEQEKAQELKRRIEVILEPER
jgi:chromosome segregation ATPase